MKETSTINIDMDKACSRCGAMGACDNGLCMTCTASEIERKLSMKVGDKTIGACIWIYHLKKRRRYADGKETRGRLDRIHSDASR